MDDTLRQKLDSLPALSSIAGLALAAPCKLCSAKAEFFDVVDFQKHCSFSSRYGFGLSGIAVPYHRCANCGFLFTTFFDEWSPAEFARYIYNDDYVLVDPDYKGGRPAKFAAMMSNLLHGREGLRILDYGAGSGIFVDEMRAAGFTATEGFDPFSSPQRPEGTFDVVTCFEALEHVAWPARAIADMNTYLRQGGCLVFSQSVQPRDIDDIRGSWWYLAPRNGHISMFTVETLQRLLPSARHTLHSDGMLWMMAPPHPHQLLSECMARMGPAIVAMSLRPPHEGADTSWHPAEPSMAGPFRWSGSDTLQWRLRLPEQLPAKLTLRLPFAMQIEPGFAAGCTLDVGGIPAEMAVSEREIFADALIESGEPDIVATLHTPTPLSPFERFGAPDGRPLGLAMVVAQA